MLLQNWSTSGVVEDFPHCMGEYGECKARPKLLLEKHGSASLCRDEQKNKMAATYNVLAFKR